MKTQLRLGSYAVIAVLVVLLLASVWYAAQGFLLPGAAMPTQGYAAMIAGVLISFVVGAGLMALLFFSSRAGYDDAPEFIVDDAPSESAAQDDPPPPMAVRSRSSGPQDH